MPGQESWLSISDGYKVLEKTEAVDADTAGKWMRTKRQHRYTSGMRSDGTIILTKHILVCPHCGHEIPAYARYLNPIFHTKKKAENRISRDIIDRWAIWQMTLYEEILPFNEVYNPTEKYICPQCGLTSRPYRASQRVRILTEKAKASVTCEITDICKLLSISWHPKKQLRLSFPMWETVVFNVANGHTYMSISDADGMQLAIRDITNDWDNWKSGTVYELLLYNKLVRRKVFQGFRQCWGKELPYSKLELTPDHFIAMTRFVGYPRGFYDAVPYSDTAGYIDETFQKLTRKLHKASDCCSIYEQTALPRMKSIRKLFFRNPGFFFYAKEAELLWNIIHDPNVFLELFEAQIIFDLLALLHRYSGIITFLHDYAIEKGAVSLVHKLNTDWETIKMYSVAYSCMSDCMRTMERAKWKREHQVPYQIRSGYSIPMYFLDRKVSNCTIDGYDFIWLRSSSDYKTAGKALKNCLGNWGIDFSCVIVVKRAGKYKAAISLREDLITEARAFDNSSIENDPELLIVYEKWKNRFHLQETASAHDNYEYAM